MSNKKLILVFVILILAGAVGYYFYFKPNGPQYDVRQASGYITSVEGDTITIKGFYESLEGPVPEKLRAERDITFKVSPTTLFTKTEIGLPSKEELIASGKAQVANGQYSASYTLDDQPRKKSAGSLEDIKSLLPNNGISVQVGFAENAYGSRVPLASGLVYLVLLGPRSQ